jgi:transmembrane sensor
MLYENYGVEDFLLDASFQKFCLGSDDNAVCFWEDWIKTHPEKKEDIEQAKQLYYLLNGNNTELQFVADENKFRRAIDHLISDEITENKPKYQKEHKGIVRKLFSAKKMLAVSGAACVIIVAGLVFLLNKKDNLKNTVSTSAENIVVSKPGEHKVIQLPDGSKVILNAQSSIQIQKGFNDESRELFLRGEAFFDVAHNPAKPFIIHTQYIDVKVLGTVFNIKSYPGEKFTETSLLKGSVELTLKSEHNKKIILKPNEKVSIKYNSEDSIHSKPNVLKSHLNISLGKIISIPDNQKDSSVAEILWNKGSLVFDNMSFEEITYQLQQWYGVTISFKDETVKQYRFTGDFNDKTIVQVLNALQLSRRFNYEIEDNNKIVISK